MILACIKEARPSQWTKNVLVFAAPAALGVLNEWSSLGKTLVVFAAFCMVASGTYYWNDILDHANDRNHPVKRFRPIASGEIPLGLARVIGVALLVVATGLAGPAFAESFGLVGDVGLAVAASAGTILVMGLLTLLARRVDNAPGVALEVADDNIAARGLYERTGFDPIGRRKAYYAGADGSRTDAVVMSRDLCAPDANLTLP